MPVAVGVILLYPVDDSAELGGEGGVVTCGEIDYATEAVAHRYDWKCLRFAVAPVAEHIPYGVF